MGKLFEQISFFQLPELPDSDLNFDFPFLNCILASLIVDCLSFQNHGFQ